MIFKNKNLFNIASSLQTEWMVNFTPFKSKQFKSSSFGLIPEDWNVGKLGDVIEILDLKRIPLSGQERKNMEKIYPYYGAASLMDYVEDYIFDGIYLLIGEDGTVIDDNGFPILQYVWGKFWVNNHAHIVEGRNGFNVDSLYLLLSKTNIQSIVTGAVQAKVNQSNLKSIEIIIPPVEVMKKFNELIKPLFDAIRSNNDEIKKLQKLRDTLLPKLMSGEIDVSKINYDLTLRIMKFILNPPNYLNRGINMKTKIISKIQNQMKEYLNPDQYIKLTNSLLNSLQDVDIIDNNNELCEKDNFKLLDLFLSAKQVEGRSPKTITYYKSTIEKMLVKIKKQIYNINTDDLRKYLFDHKNEKQSSKTTIDNIRRILSSFFSWLEDEDYILKNPVRRIHKVKTGRTVKEVLTDENLETLRDKCDEIRDLAMLELLISTGIRVGELVRLNISDIDFYERECVVFGKGESERIVYFDARTKIHLMQYIQQRTDENPALFVSLNKPNTRLGISGIETRLRELGEKCNIKKVHPHKFRRTMATNAIDKGMPIEQVQKLLGHVQIDTTMQYAMVNQSNVKHAHRKFIG